MQQQPIDPRDAALIEIAADVVGRLIWAHHNADAAAAVAEVERLLNAVVAFNKAHAEPASHEALRRAVSRMGAL